MKTYKVDFFMYPDSTARKLDFVDAYAQILCKKIGDGACVRDVPISVSVSLATNPDKNYKKPCNHGWWFTYHFKNNTNTIAFAEGIAELNKYVCSVSYQLGRFKVCSKNPKMGCY